MARTSLGLLLVAVIVVTSVLVIQSGASPRGLLVPPVFVNDPKADPGLAETGLVTGGDGPGDHATSRALVSAECREPRAADSCSDPEWLSGLLSAPDLGFRFLGERLREELRAVLRRDSYVAYVGYIRDTAADCSIDGILRLIPASHPFWQRYPKAAAQIANRTLNDHTLGDVLSLPTDSEIAERWHCVRDQYADWYLWGLLGRQIANLPRARPSNDIFDAMGHEFLAFMDRALATSCSQPRVSLADTIQAYEDARLAKERGQLSSLEPAELTELTRRARERENELLTLVSTVSNPDQLFAAAGSDPEAISLAFELASLREQLDLPGFELEQFLSRYVGH